jgi:hypothetical protein
MATFHKTSRNIIVDETLLRDCLSAFNQLRNTKLRNGTCTYDLAERLEVELERSERSELKPGLSCSVL